MPLLRATAANPSLTLPAVGSDGTGKRLFGGEDGVSAKKTDPSGLPGATALSARESASARPLHAPGPARISLPDHQHVTGGLALLAAGIGNVGDRVIAHFHHIGRGEGLRTPLVCNAVG